MRRTVCWLLLPGAAAGCVPYPRFVHVYQTPQYTGLFIDRQHRPVPNVLVSISGYRQQVQTGVNGIAMLPARRTFQVIGFVVMDSWPTTLVRAGWSDSTPHTRDKSRGWLEHEHRVRFFPNQRQITVVQDTVVLPIP